MAQASLREVAQMSKNQRGPSDHETLTMEGQIRQRAYELYEQGGRRDGRHLEDWIQAEDEVRNKLGLGKAA